MTIFFRRRPINADLFPNAVFQRAKTIRSSSTWNRENWNVNYRGMKIPECVFLFKMLDGRLLIFENGTWVRAHWSSDVELLRRCKTAVDWKVQRFENLIWFLACCNELLIVFEMRFSARPNLFIKCSFKFGGDETPLWCEFEEDLSFQKIFWCSEKLD